MCEMATTSNSGPTGSDILFKISYLRPWNKSGWAVKNPMLVANNNNQTFKKEFYLVCSCLLHSEKTMEIHRNLQRVETFAQMQPQPLLLPPCSFWIQSDGEHEQKLQLGNVNWMWIFQWVLKISEIHLSWNHSNNFTSVLAMELEGSPRKVVHLQHRRA